jgi:hypothetical protein
VSPEPGRSRQRNSAVRSNGAALSRSSLRGARCAAVRRSPRSVGIIFHQWVAAWAAEAAVLAGHPDSPGLLDRATAASQGNPIAAAVARRVAALVGDGAVDIRARFDAVAADWGHAGAHCEAQRTRHLAATRAAIPLGWSR